MVNRYVAAVGIISASFLLNPPVASATVLDGETIRATWNFPDFAGVVSSADVVVGPGEEVPPDFGGFGVDLSDTNIFFSGASSASYTPATFNGWHFFDFSASIPAFTSVVINPATNMVGFNGSRITFDANNIYVDFESLLMTSATVVSLDLTAVPEPSTFILAAALGLLGVGCRRRKRA